ncbi:MAG: DUF4249 domain-containing protein [Runella sp.]
MTFSSLRILLLASILLGCVEEYDIRYNLDAKVLTVEGFVTETLGGTQVSINTSVGNGGNSYSEPLKGCTVELLTDNGTVPFREVVSGVYAPAATFQGQSGKSYQLRFRTPDGQTYLSSKETLTTVPPIKKVYQTFDPKGLLDRTGQRVLASTFDIYLDFDDPRETQNFYLWRWKRYEFQDICITCEGGTLNTNGGVCIKSNARNPPTYDYQCDRPCWEVFYNQDVNIFSDVFSNGQMVQGRLIAKVPFHSTQGCLLEIEQIGLSREAFLYYQLLRDQVQTTGTLTDTPPAPIIGNITNINNPSDKVVGYFGAASSQKIAYWVTRNERPDGIRRPLLGRPTLLEEPTPFRPPVYPCVMSRTRTPIRPEGWR